MPMYDFQCKNEDCKKVFEMVAKAGTKEADCPDCHSRAKWILSAPNALRFFFNYMEP